MDALSSILEFLAHLGGLLALVFFIALGVKFWKEAEEEEQDD